MSRSLSSAPPEKELPALRDSPSPQVLLQSLQALRVEVPVWSAQASRAEIAEQQAAWVTAHDRREVVSYLAQVVKSSLSWFGDESERERIWTEASKRMAERCGRAAVGEIMRRWSFDVPGQGGPFHLNIREPSLAGDDALGLKTWGSSYALAKLLPQLGSDPVLSRLLWPAHHHQEDGLKRKERPTRMLELGSGTGLLGLAAACFWQADIVLTDLPAILPNLEHNAELNRGVWEAHGGRVEVAALTWGACEAESSSDRFKALHQYELIMAADGLYDDHHPALLSSVIDAQLSLVTEARALAMVPFRDEVTTGLVVSFRAEMGRQARPLVCLHEGTVAGQDDWGDDTAGSQDSYDGHGLTFWWGVFGRL